MEKLVIKWKHWYWYCLSLFNVLIPIFLALNRLLSAKSVLISGSTESWVFLALSSPALITLFLIYVFKAMQEANACRVIIKPTRFKYFKWGLIAAFVSFNLYVIALLVAHKSGDTTANVMVYISLVLCAIFGTTSTVFLTMYEFCVNFDIFYNKNKETIIKQYLEHTKNKIKEGDLGTTK